MITGSRVLVSSVRQYHPTNVYSHSIDTSDDRAAPALGSPGICQCPPALPASQISDVNAFRSFPWARRTRGTRKNLNPCGSPHLKLIRQAAGLWSLGPDWKCGIQPCQQPTPSIRIDSGNVPSSPLPPISLTSISLTPLAQSPQSNLNLLLV